ncbi:hypothetical protein BCT11_26360 [Vibrio sp. 10N.222.52.B12]|nr:hypothetical protein BCT11_26360 [Vibrio sp. 10N.222.52.B12]
MNLFYYLQFIKTLHSFNANVSLPPKSNETPSPMAFVTHNHETSYLIDNQVKLLQSFSAKQIC